MNQDNEKITLELTSEEARQLQTAFELLKALSSPERLALVGLLAAHPSEGITIAELKAQLSSSPANIEREVGQLAGAGLVQITEWQTRPGHEPQPAKIIFNPEYPKQIPQTIAALARLNRRSTSAEPSVALDERAKTIATFIKDGRLVTFPAQYKRQIYVLEEIVNIFEPGLRYTERQIDAILKEVYEYDHCTLRRYLVDLNLLQRQDGIYWKPTRAADAG